MRTATVRELRNEFSKLESWLANGETIEICRRGEPVATLTQPCSTEKTRKPTLDELIARRDRDSGGTTVSLEQLAEEKAFALEGQQG